MARLYRKSALDKLSSPDQLDKALVITSPLSWLVLIGITVILAVVVTWSIKGSIPVSFESKGIIINNASASMEVSPIVGDVRTIKVKKGQDIKKGDVIMTIKKRSGTETIDIKATQSGLVNDVLVAWGDEVNKGSELIRLAPSKGKGKVIALYVKASSINLVKEDMSVDIYPTAYNSQKYGHMKATVFRVEKYPVNVNNLHYILGADNQLSNEFTQEGSVYQVLCNIERDESTASGYWWSTANSKDLIIDTGTIVKAKIITEEVAPITKLIPEFVNN